MTHEQIDRTRPQLRMRRARGVSGGGMRTEIRIRQFEPFYTDEPSQAGGTDSGPTPLETCMAAFCG